MSIVRAFLSIACMAFLASSPALADFEITDFSDTEIELTFPPTPAGPENTAEIAGPALQVTPGLLSNVGAAWTTEQFEVTEGFTTTFEFEFLRSPSGGGGGSGDGLAFVLHNDSLDAVGNHAAAMGYGGFLNAPERGINHSLAVELDGYRNANWGDTDGNHISVHTMYAEDNSHHEDSSIGAAPVASFRQGSGPHVVRIEYFDEELSVYFDDLEVPVLTVEVDLAEVLDADDAWMGFSGSGGAAYQVENVYSWSFTNGDVSVPGPVFRRGDFDNGGALDISDAIASLNYQFSGGAAPPCRDAADADDSGEVNISDPIYALAFLFSGGEVPPAPGPLECGPDPTEDETEDLGCAEQPDCR